jgi:hypothetical protein
MIDELKILMKNWKLITHKKELHMGRVGNKEKPCDCGVNAGK